MLLIQRARKRALSVPGIALLLVPATLLLTTTLAVPASWGERGVAAGFGALMLLYCVLAIRVTSWDGRQVVVRSLFRRVALHAETCAFRVSVEGSRSPTIYLRAVGPDGTKATIAEWMAFGEGPAKRKAAELEQLVGTHALPEAQTVEALARASAQREIDAYYAGSSWKWISRIALTLFALALAASIALVAYLHWSDAP